MHLPLLFPKIMVDDLCGKAHPQINVSSSQLVVVKSHFPLAMLFQTEFLVWSGSCYLPCKFPSLYHSVTAPFSSQCLSLNWAASAKLSMCWPGPQSPIPFPPVEPALVTLLMLFFRERLMSSLEQQCFLFCGCMCWARGIIFSSMCTQGSRLIKKILSRHCLFCMNKQPLLFV